MLPRLAAGPQVPGGTPRQIARRDRTTEVVPERPKSIEGTRAKLKRLVELDILIEIDTDSFARKQ
ncbi:hypothetical protein [Streptomyces sp. NPDC048295]|uniref:hypothetical protein n=1 Tax=Streptomyces sp. NPDC048295 TaxID=3154617 RepID=UPI0034354450